MPTVSVGKMRLWGSRASKAPVSEDELQGHDSCEVASAERGAVNSTSSQPADVAGQAPHSAFAAHCDLRKKTNDRIYAASTAWTSWLAKRKPLPFEMPSDEMKRTLEEQREEADPDSVAMRELLVSVAAKDKILPVESLAVAMASSARLLEEPQSESGVDIVQYVEELQMLAAMHMYSARLQKVFSEQIKDISLGRLARSHAVYDRYGAAEKNFATARAKLLATQKKVEKKSKDGKAQREAEEEERRARAACDEAARELEEKASFVADTELAPAGMAHLRSCLEAQLQYVDAQRDLLLALQEQWAQPTSLSLRLHRIGVAARMSERKIANVVDTAIHSAAPLTSSSSGSSQPAGRLRSASMPRPPPPPRPPSSRISGQDSGSSRGTTSRSSSAANLATSTTQHAHSQSLGSSFQGSSETPGFTASGADASEFGARRSRLSSLTGALSRGGSSTSIQKKGASTSATGGSSGSSSGGGFGIGEGSSSSPATRRGMSAKFGAKRRETAGFKTMSPGGNNDAESASHALGHIVEMSGGTVQAQGSPSGEADSDVDGVRRQNIDKSDIDFSITNSITKRPTMLVAKRDNRHYGQQDPGSAGIGLLSHLASPPVSSATDQHLPSSSSYEWQTFDAHNGGLSPTATGLFIPPDAVGAGPEVGLRFHHTGQSDGDPFGGGAELSPQGTGDIPASFDGESAVKRNTLLAHVRRAGTEANSEDSGKEGLLPRPELSLKPSSSTGTTSVGGAASSLLPHVKVK